MEFARSGAAFAPIDPDPQHAVARALRTIERGCDRLFGAHENPLRQLGALAMASFWLSVATGAWLYAGFETSADGAWRSVREFDAHPVHGAVRGLHRYASFSLLALSLVHVAAEWARGRYRGFRWFTWVSGVPLPWLAAACGVVGYWLVADTRSQFVAATLGEWLGVLPGIGASMMRNFVTAQALSDRLLSLLMFLHIGLGLITLAAIWVHLARLVRPQTWPRRRSLLLFAGALLAASLLAPAGLGTPADFTAIGGSVPVDWVVYGVLPVAHRASPALAWSIVVLPTLLLLALPWLRARRATLPQPAVVDAANCNGCRRCFDDCPYGAIEMAPHPRRRSRQIAAVLAERCAGCGICVGACPSASPFRSVRELVTGIDLPQRPLDTVRAELQRELARASTAGTAPIVEFVCDHAAARPSRHDGGTRVTIPLPCSAALPPAFAEYALRAGAAGVQIVDCGSGGCVYRFGAAFTRDRCAGRREPHLRQHARADVTCVDADGGQDA